MERRSRAFEIHPKSRSIDGKSQDGICRMASSNTAWQQDEGEEGMKRGGGGGSWAEQASVPGDSSQASSTCPASSIMTCVNSRALSPCPVLPPGACGFCPW